VHARVAAARADVALEGGLLDRGDAGRDRVVPEAGGLGEDEDGECLGLCLLDRRDQDRHEHREHGEQGQAATTVSRHRWLHLPGAGSRVANQKLTPILARSLRKFAKLCGWRRN
jgi:hypothetical protein